MKLAHLSFHLPEPVTLMGLDRAASSVFEAMHYDCPVVCTRYPDYIGVEIAYEGTPEHIPATIGLIERSLPEGSTFTGISVERVS